MRWGSVDEAIQKKKGDAVCGGVPRVCLYVHTRKKGDLVVKGRQAKPRKRKLPSPTSSTNVAKRRDKKGSSAWSPLSSRASPTRPQSLPMLI